MAGRHRRRQPTGRALRVASAGAAVLLLAVAAIAARALTEPVPAASAQLVARFPTEVPGRLPPLPLPSEGEAEVSTSWGQVLGSTGADTPAPLASVTKVMTAYVILTDYPLQPGQSGPEITVSKALAASMEQREAEDQSLVPLEAGEELSELQALEALLIPSADDVADMLAQFDAGTIGAFVAKMNRTARSLGMDHTDYADASGFDPASRSTVADQIVLARRAMQNPVFAEIVDMPSVTLPLAGRVTNYNSLAGTDGYRGIKTGSTSAAGGCLVWSVTRTVEGVSVTLYGVVLGQHSGPLISAAIAEAKKLTDAAFQVFTERTVVPAGTTVFSARRAGHTSEVVTVSPLKTVMPPGAPVTVAVEPASKGSRSGAAALSSRVALRAAGTSAGSTGARDGKDPATGLRLERPLGDPSLGWRLDHLL